MLTLSKTRARGRRRWNSGVAALEFGLLAIPIFALVVVLMELAYGFYCQEMMDYAVESAARQIQVGTAQASTGGAAAFIQKSICSTLGTMLPCGGVALSSQIVTDYYSLTNVGKVPTTNGTFNSSSLTFCTGTPGQLVLFTAYYPATAIVSPYLPVTTVAVNGKTVRMIVSTAAFMNEQYNTSGAGGC